MIAHVARGVLVLDQPFVPTCSTVDEPMQERGAWSRDAAGFVAVILRVMVLEHRLDLFKGLPAHRRGVLIIDPAFPLMDGQPLLRGGMGRRFLAHLPGAAVHKCSRIGGILERGENRGDGWLFPDQLAMHVTARDGSRVVIEKAEDLARRVALQKGGEEQFEAALNFQIGILLDPLEFIAPEAHGQLQG